MGRETLPKGGEHAARQIEANIALRQQGQPCAKHVSTSPNLEDDIPCLGLGHRQHSADDGLAVLLGQADTLIIGLGLQVKWGETITHIRHQPSAGRAPIEPSEYALPLITRQVAGDRHITRVALRQVEHHLE